MTEFSGCTRARVRAHTHTHWSVLTHYGMQSSKRTLHTLESASKPESELWRPPLPPLQDDEELQALLERRDLEIRLVAAANATLVVSPDEIQVPTHPHHPPTHPPTPHPPAELTREPPAELVSASVAHPAACVSSSM
jgi:hypothetical protein